MAGDWIKWVKGFARKREVVACANKLGVDRRHIACTLMELFEWADENTEDGHVKGVSASDIDNLVGCPGLGLVLSELGWIRVSERGVSFVNFTRHNGKSAKARALDTVRKSKKFPDQNRKKNGALFSSLSLPFSSPEFLTAWKDFCEYRARKSGKGWTPRAAAMVIAKLTPWGEEAAIRALREAIEKSWTTVFNHSEDKPKPKNGSAWDKAFEGFKA